MNMQCEEARPLVELYADDELELSRSLEFERHVANCAPCAQMLQGTKALSRSIRASGIYGEAPSGLSHRVRAAMLREAGVEEPSKVRVAPPRRAVIGWWRPLGIAAAAILILAVFAWRWVPTHPANREQNTLLAQEVLDSHVRSMMADHLFDVPSTDQHTVKPWFDGKLDFSPPVVDLTPQGFELTGGRLDYIDGRPVATVVYRRRKHIINLSMWPDNATAPLTATMRNGYNLLHWKNGALEFWAVSDLNASELREFVGFIQANAR